MLLCIIGGVIAIRNLSMRLTSGGREVSILNDISLDVPAKQFVAIVGPSGSGKSTLLGLIAGMDQPTSGTISLEGQEITSLSEDELARLRRRKIGYVFQSFHLIPTLTAQENVAVPLELAGDPEAVSKANALLRAVGLGSRLHHYPAQLSGGEQQRVSVARAFANNPAILLADEPTGNLDTATGEQVIELLIRLNRDHGSTLVLVTHDPALAAHAERIVCLRDGRIISDELQQRVPGARP
jgi:putative ABC transport system ATP-binding protein